MKKIKLMNLPKIENRASILFIDPLKEFPKLIELGEISERISSTAFYLQNISDKSNQLVAENRHFRAALTEFASISELLKLKYKNLSIENLEYPLLHFFKELRVTNFHIKSFKTSLVEKKMIWSGVYYPNDQEYEFIHSFLIIENCNIELFTSNKNFIKYYNHFAFHSTINWVNENQQILGIKHVFNAALVQYCELIIEKLFNNQRLIN